MLKRRIIKAQYERIIEDLTTPEPTKEETK